jgi:hypothetical protein
LPANVARRQILTPSSVETTQKIQYFQWLPIGLDFAPRQPGSVTHRPWLGLSTREEFAMSLSVNSTNTTNPFAFLQSMMQQGPSQTGSSTQSDPLSQLMSFLDQESGASAASSSASSSSGSSTSTSGAATSATTPQFGQQMLQALFALQAEASNSLSSQFGGSSNAGAANSADPTQQAQEAHGHHHQGMSGGGASPAEMLSALSPAGASGQTVANTNGSSTTTISYADGSSVSMTTAPSSSSASDTSSSTAGSTAASNNLLEQLIQMQAQLLNTATPQSIMTV